MLVNNTDIIQVLERGGTVVVPNRQRAVAIRMAHTRAQLAAGVRTWNSCDVIPFAAWLERAGASARHGALQGCRRLGAAEEWLEWRAAATVACEGTEVLMPAALGDALRQSAALLRDWSLHSQSAPGIEAQVLARARDAIARRCAALHAVSADDWPRLLADLPPTGAPLLFAGFEAPGSALVARLQALGAVIGATPDAALDAAHGADQVQACADRLDELRRAAQWCRERLARDGTARLLVIVPQLAQWRAAAVQCFEHALHGSGLLQQQPMEPLYALEGGAPLAEFALVRTALSLLAVAGQALEFAELAALLRSPYLGCGSRQARCALELVLRDRNVHSASLAGLRTLARCERGALVAGLAPLFDALALQLQPEPGSRASAAAWARSFAGWLAAAGWPGEQALGSDEQQQRERFEALLGEFAQLGDAGGLLGHAGAIELLRSLAGRVAFEPASEDVPVTITASTGDPLVHYDGIWVAGLSAENWPPPARPDPFVPVGVQRAAGIGAASAAGQLALARHSMWAWRQAAGVLVLSWPQFEGDARLQPSSLLNLPLPSTEDDSAPPLAAQPDALAAALRASAVLELRPADRMSAWPQGQSLPRGTRALTLQSACPFRAAAELRLGAMPLGEPVSGLDARERGQFLHRALQATWERLGSSRALKGTAAPDLTALVGVAIDTALGELIRLRATELAPPLLENERQRAAVLLAALLAQEAQRADFSIATLEGDERHTLGGLPIKVRMDRLDRLDDGRLVVLDYKSGAPQAFITQDERPQQPQLLAYALLVPGELAGVAAVHLRPDAIHWRGAAAQPEVLPKLSTRGAAPSWGEQLAHWRRVIDALVQGFVSGDAAVQPRADACEQCHLAALCRIDSAGLAVVEPGEYREGVQPRVG